MKGLKAVKAFPQILSAYTHMTASIKLPPAVVPCFLSLRLPPPPPTHSAHPASPVLT